jgi:trehalose-6-phosphate synthase
MTKSVKGVRHIGCSYARRMRRFYFLWIYAVLLAAAGAGAVQSFLEERHLLADERSKAASLASNLEENIDGAMPGQAGHPVLFDRLNRTVRRLQNQQRLVGIAICAYNPVDGKSIPQASHGFPVGFNWQRLCDAPRAGTALAAEDASWFPSPSSLGEREPRRLHYYFHRLDLEETSDLGPHPNVATHGAVYVLALARDLSYLRALWIESFLRGFFVTLILGITLLVLVTSQMRRWLQRNLAFFHKNLRSIIAGKRPPSLQRVHDTDSLKELRPITEDIDQLARILSMKSRRSNAMPDTAGMTSTLTRTIAQKNLVVIANREPYIHQRNAAGNIEVIRPASGLVTALEPILRQCGGLWIAHGSGTADFEVTNAQGEVPVPPEKPTYSLKRLKLTQEQEVGYYYGFANEGLWPLCHLAHTRPVFRLSDWKYYMEVNQLFADSIPEAALHSDSLFLVQDYHFALLPEMLKKRTTRFRKPKVGIFWHIPWPNPEAFGICPWNQELLRGMLGADIIGFHTQHHCNNFLEACNRYLEARIDYEHFSVTMGNHETRVRAFPIGIDTTPVKVLHDDEVAALKAKYGIHAEFVAVGVDRIDYTKGIIERVEAVERFLEKNPEFVGRFSLVQMGSPSRTHIPAYQLLFKELERVVDRVNARFAKGDYKPVIFIPTHHEWKDIQFFYQLGDLCMVTSLHDGMNLVAKEYVWCQKPERGSLILSKFTGASRELTEAFIVNPYSIEEMADAIHAALSLSPEEKAARMTSMREKVHARNAYRWASELIEALLIKESVRESIRPITYPEPLGLPRMTPRHAEGGRVPLKGGGPKDTWRSGEARLR